MKPNNGINSFRDVMELWPTVNEFAVEIGVPVSFWSAVLGTRKARKAHVTADLLVEIAARHVEPVE